MEIILKSKYDIGDRVFWYAPYGAEFVTIKEVVYENGFKYKTEEYSFWFNESEF